MKKKSCPICGIIIHYADGFLPILCNNCEDLAPITESITNKLPNGKAKLELITKYDEMIEVFYFDSWGEAVNFSLEVFPNIKAVIGASCKTENSLPTHVENY